MPDERNVPTLSPVQGEKQVDNGSRSSSSSSSSSDSGSSSSGNRHSSSSVDVYLSLFVVFLGVYDCFVLS